MEWFQNIDPVWLSLGPVLIINIILSSSLVYFLLTRKRREVHPEAKKRFNSRFLSGHLKAWWYWNIDPVARFFIRLKITPNILTLIGFLFSGVAAFFFAKGLFGFAGWAMLIGGTFDLFDGQVARVTKQVSKSGAFFDSVMDRFSEGLVFLGLAYYFRDSWLLAFLVLGLTGSMAVSYTKARGEAVGVEVKGGSMQRPERVVYLGCSSIFQPLLTYFLATSLGLSAPPYLVIAAIVLIGVMSNFTAIYRMIYVMNHLDSEEKKSEVESIPQFLSKLTTPEGRKVLRLKNRYGYDRSRAQFKLCLLLMVDGAHPAVLKRLMDEGRLPNLARRFQEKGERREAISVFPSATGPALTPFVTGCYPGTCNVPGIRWFDRTIPATRRLTTKRFRDYFGFGVYALDFDLSKEVRTIFEYSRRAYNILGMVNRGSGMLRDPAFLAAPYLFYKVKKQEKVEVVEETAFRWFENAVRKEPDFIFYNFPTIDFLSHETDPAHPKVIAAYQRLDRYIGKIERVLEEEGLFEETLWILSSDHGHSKIDAHFDLEAFLENRFETLYYPKTFQGWEKAEAVNMVTGNGMSHIYLKRGTNWKDLFWMEAMEKMGLIEALLERKEIDLLMGRSEEGGIRVISQRGEAKIIEESDGRITYRVRKGDPFGFGELPLVLSSREALEKTAATIYPDAITQVAQLFRSVRTGDLVVSASLGFDLRKRFEEPPHRSGHGTLHREHMLVPCYWSPVLMRKEWPLRTVDLFATILEVMGIEPTHRLDGCSLPTSRETGESFIKTA